MSYRVASLLVGVLALAGAARGADDFAAQVDLSPLRTLVIQHQQTLKTLDSFARQTLTSITGRATIDGRDPVFSMLDIAYRPAKYVDRPLIRIRNLPLRRRVAELARDDAQQRQRIMKEGTISLGFYTGSKVAAALEQLQSQDARLSPAIEEASGAAGTMEMLGDPTRFELALIPPGGSADQSWKTPRAVLGNSPKWAKYIEDQGDRPHPALPGYEGKAEVLTGMIDAYIELGKAWAAENAGQVNRQAKLLGELAAEVNPGAYPALVKRSAEVWYNRLEKFTVPGFMFYFVAFASFLLSAGAGMRRLRRAGIGFMALALLVHTAGIGIRWWVAPAGRIPIMNQFESVMAAAWFGAVIGVVLEVFRPKGVYGAAASFVGWVSLVALWATPIVTGVQIGADIGQVGGILLSFWLYIHVNLTIASYALIGMSFLLGVWWLVQHARGGDEGFMGTLDACNVVVLQLAFWLLGAGIITGAVWADSSWGRPWGWDPKETFALVTWIVYLLVVHIRLVAARKAFWTAALSSVAFFVMLFNWIGVNFFMVGLHSYA